MKPPRSTGSAARRGPLIGAATLALTALPMDVALVVLLVALAPIPWDPNDRAPVIALLALAGVLGALAVGGYRVTRPTRLRASLGAAGGLLLGLVGGWLALKVAAVKFGHRALSPPGLWPFVAVALGASVAAALGRLAIALALRRRERDAPVLLVGPADAAAALESRLRRAGEHSAVVTTPLDALPDALHRPGLRALVLAIPPTGWPRETVEDVAVARAHGLIVTTPARFLEEILERTPLDTLDDPWLVLDEALTRRSPLYLALKRVLDLALGGLALIAALPLMALIAIGVRLSGPGPVLYRQERAGLRREPFMLLKFRTMRPDAEADTGPIWAAENDPRATPLGRLLRRSRLDELPQLVNVLSGHMSLVGPRPERPELEHELAPRLPFYVLRHLAKPGLTGWAQVRLPYGASVEDSFAKLEHDLYYLKRASLGFDLAILARTVPIVLGLRGR